MSTRSYESLIRGDIGRFCVRVWRTEPDASAIQNSDITAFIQTMHDKFMFDPESDLTPYAIVKELSDFPRVAAVEAWDRSSDETLLVYLDWPN